MPPPASSCRPRSGASARWVSAIRRGAAPWCSRSCRGRRTTPTTTSTSTASTPAATTAPRRSTRPFPDRWRAPASCSRVRAWEVRRARCRRRPATSPAGPSDIRSSPPTGAGSCWWKRRRAARRRRARASSLGCDPHAFAGGVRYQVAVGRRNVLVFDAFAARDPDLEETAPPARRLTEAAPDVDPVVVGDASPAGSAFPDDLPDRESPGPPAEAEGGSGAAADVGTGTAGSPAPDRAHPPAGAPPPVPVVTLARPPWRDPPAHDFVGVPCGGCHNAQQKWWRGHPHSRAAARLRNRDRRAVDIARAYGVSADDMTRGTQTCMWCHGTVTSRPSRRVRAGVGCQRCHGAGADYRDPHQTASYTDSVALGLTDLRDPAVAGGDLRGVSLHHRPPG